MHFPGVFRQITVFAIGLFLFLTCQKVPNPFDPSEAKISLYIKTADGRTGETARTDTVGNHDTICLVRYLAEYIDSVEIEVRNAVTVEFSFFTKTRSKQIDTVKYPVTFGSAGERIITATGYVTGKLNPYASATILILDRAQENSKPVLTINGTKAVTAGDTVRLTATAIDPDPGQTLTITALRMPGNASFNADSFTWATTLDDTGSDTAIFIATDDGAPVMADTDTVIITVSATPVNRPPKWTADTVPLQGQPGTALSLSLADKCSDPDGDDLTFSLLPGSPAGDTVIDSTWSFTPGEGDTGDVTPQIVARDPSGSTDTLTIDLAITAEDRVPPTLTRITPARDTVTVASSTYQITISARDPSGVASITCAMGADTFPVTSSDTLYTSTVAGLRPATLNQIAFIATDASARANRCTLYVHVTYDSTVADNVPPIITLLSPARDTIIGVDSCAIRVRCTDQSGVASVTISAGSATVPAAREADNVFSATIKTLIGGQNTTVTITATDSAATPNAGTSTVRIKYDNDRTRPSLALISPVTGSRVGTSSVTVQVSCKDASGIASLTCSMGSNLFTVTKSSSADSLYSATITGLVAGQFNQITFVAVDSSLNANRDSLVVSINYDNDTTGPAITRVTPAGESVTTNASSYTITVSCTDPSGVASVIAAMGAQSFTGGKGTGNNWTIPVTGLTVTTVNTVTVTAIDSSLKANRSTLPVYINYDPTMEDTVGPTIRQVSGPVSGSIVAAPVVTIVDSITDPSGIDSVYWTRNGGVKKIMSPVTGNAGHYSLKDTLTEGTHDTIRVTAVDKSTRRNRSAQTIILQYINAPAITTQPVSKAVCGGSQAIFSVIAAGTAPLSYQWRKGASTFTNINGAIAPSCTLNAVSSADNGTVLSCVISNESGTSVTSNLCTPTMNTVSTKPTAAATPASVCPGDSSTLSVSAGTLGTGAAWKWYTSKTGSAITTTRVAPSTAAWYFVRGEGTCGNSPWDSIRITLNTISTKPTPTASATDICPGTTCTLSVSAGTLGTGASWKWYTAKTGTALSSTTVTPTAATWYFVRGEGTCGNSAWDSVRIAVKSRPTITTPPASVSVCPTLQAVFTVTASGTSPLTYQWRKGSAALPNATTPSCTLTNVQSIDNNSVITCAVTNECGTTVSNPCTLRVNILSVVPTSISASPTSICPGGSATLSVAGGTLGTGAQWHWYSLGCGLGPVGTGSSIIVNPNSTTTYYVRAEGGCGTTACVSRSLTVNDAPTITTQPPAACTLCINSSFGLNVPVVASGTGLTYQWYRNGAALSDDAVFGGTTTASLYIKGYNTTDRSGSYYCIITNASDCTVRSNTTVVTMRNDC